MCEVRSLDALDAIAVEWNALLASTPQDTPFARHEYVRAWWQTLGGGEWRAAELCVFTLRDGRGALRGVVPLFAATSHTGATTLRLLGACEVTDYLDLIAAPEDRGALIAAMFDWLSSAEAPPWRDLVFDNVLEDSVTLPSLASAAAERGFSYRQERGEPCPLVTLREDWDTFLAGMERKRRHDLRRTLHRAERWSVPVRFEVVRGGPRLERELEALLGLMANDPRKAAFLTPPMRAHMRATVLAAAEGGWLQLALLWVGDARAAVSINFEHARRVWVYNSGMDPRFAAISPGRVLLGEVLRHAHDHGLSHLDFLRGDEAYKVQLGAVPRFIARATVTR